jgi:hypothetical protein
MKVIKFDIFNIYFELKIKTKKISKKKIKATNELRKKTIAMREENNFSWGYSAGEKTVFCINCVHSNEKLTKDSQGKFCKILDRVHICSHSSCKNFKLKASKI